MDFPWDFDSSGAKSNDGSDLHSDGRLIWQAFPGGWGIRCLICNWGKHIYNNITFIKRLFIRYKAHKPAIFTNKQRKRTLSYKTLYINYKDEYKNKSEKMCFQTLLERCESMAILQHRESGVFLQVNFNICFSGIIDVSSKVWMKLTQVYIDRKGICFCFHVGNVHTLMIIIVSSCIVLMLCPGAH